MPRIGTADYARALARSAYTDPQFRVPERPSLRPEVVLVHRDDAIVLDGVGLRVTLRGERTVAALRALLPLLDGHRDAAQLAADAALPPPNVRQLLGLLTMRSALQDGPAEAQPGVPETTWRQLSRAASAIGWHDRADGVRDALGRADLVVLGSGTLAAAVFGELRRTHLFGDVRRGLSANHADPTLILACFDGPVETDQRELVVDLVERRGLAVLPVLHESGLVSCGPCLEPQVIPCVNCFFTAMSTYERREETSCPGDATAIAAGLVVGEVLHLIGGCGRSVTASTLVRHDIRNWTSSFLDVTARPGCEPCFPTIPDGDTLPPDLDLIRSYEAAVCLPARRWLPPAVHREHYKAGHIAAQQRFGRVEGTVRPQTPRATAVSQLLRMAVGLRTAPRDGSAPDRYAPSSGNLGAVLAYCVLPAEGKVPARACQYDPLRHELVDLGADPADALACMKDLEVPLTAPSAAAVLFCADLTKLYPKYGLKAYRLAWLEAGSALSQLALAAGLHDIWLQSATTWDDDAWSHLLGSDTRGELICAAAVLAGPEQIR